MLEKCQNAQERWGGVSDIIDTLLASRQSLISLFVALPSQSITHGLNEKLSKFCVLLMKLPSNYHCLVKH